MAGGESQQAAAIAASDDRPVFIVGFPRSGTTLMRALLSAHSMLAIGPETHFLNKFAKRAKTLDLETPERFLEFWARLTRSDRFVDLGVDADAARDLILESADFRLRNVFATLLRQYARAAGKPRWGEKTPAHDRHLSTLFGWFPAARVIYMVRDPRAACASLLRAPWRLRRAPAAAPGMRPARLVRLRLLDEDAFYWRRSVERHLAHWQDDQRVRAVRYEDLVREPEETLREVCRFLDVEFEAGMLETRSAEALPPVRAELADKQHESWRRAHIERARQAVAPDSVEKWRRELSSLEVAVVEVRCRRRMASFGYEPVASASSLQLRLRASLSRMVAVLLQPAVASRQLPRSEP